MDNQIIAMDIESKKCKKCDKIKPKTEYNYHKDTCDKLDHRCKKCVQNNEYTHDSQDDEYSDDFDY